MATHARVKKDNKTRFQRMKHMIMNHSSGRKDHYQALRYYLIGSKTVKKFIPVEQMYPEPPEGYSKPSDKEPARHPWVENMRTIVRRLGYPKAMKFLHFCIQRNLAPSMYYYLDRFEEAQKYKQTYDKSMQLLKTIKSRTKPMMTYKTALKHFGNSAIDLAVYNNWLASQWKSGSTRHGHVFGYSTLSITPKGYQHV